MIDAVKRTSNSILDREDVLVANLRGVIKEIGNEERTLDDLLKPHDAGGRMQRIAVLLRLAKFGIVAITPVEGAGGVKRGPGDPA
jgi:hypothetical protein